MHSFQLTVLASGGGPFDGSTSSYLIKSFKTPWCQNCLVGIDGGSLLGSIASTLETQIATHEMEDSNSNHKEPDNNYNEIILTPDILNWYPDSSPVADYIRCDFSKTSFPSSLLPYDSIISNSSFILSEYIKSFCITHPHLDHIAGLVINCPDFSPQNSKVFYGLKDTIDAIHNHIFNGIIWPNLTNRGDSEGKHVLLEILEPKKYYEVAVNLSVSAYPLSHGVFEGNYPDLKSYESTAYFIRDSMTDNQILVLGDVEPDSISTDPQTHTVWEYASLLILHGRLSAIMIECSHCGDPSDETLFGHLSPSHLIDELVSLNEAVATLVSQKYPIASTNDSTDYINDDDSKRISYLSGLNIILTHIKEDTQSGKEPRRQILQTLDIISKGKNLNCIFSVALPGVTYLL